MRAPSLQEGTRLGGRRVLASGARTNDVPGREHPGVDVPLADAARRAHREADGTLTWAAGRGHVARSGLVRGFLALRVDLGGGLGLLALRSLMRASRSSRRSYTRAFEPARRASASTQTCSARSRCGRAGVDAVLRDADAQGSLASRLVGQVELVRCGVLLGKRRLLLSPPATSAAPGDAHRRVERDEERLDAEVGVPVVEPIDEAEQGFGRHRGVADGGVRVVGGDVEALGELLEGPGGHVGRPGESLPGIPRGMPSPQPTAAPRSRRRPAASYVIASTGPATGISTAACMSSRSRRSALTPKGAPTTGASAPRARPGVKPSAA